MSCKRREKVRVKWSSLCVLLPWRSWVCFRPLFSQTQCDSPTGIPIRWGHVSDTCHTHVSGALHGSCTGFWCLETPTAALESLITINCVHVITALLSWHPWSRGKAAPCHPPSLFLCPCSSVLQSTFIQVIQLGMGSSGYNALYIQVKYQSV